MACVETVGGQFFRGIRNLPAVTAAVAVLGLGVTFPGGEQNTVSAEDFVARMRALDSELRALQQGEGAPPAYKAFLDEVKRQRELQQKHSNELNQSSRRLSELRQEKAVQDWQNKIELKNRELNELRVQIEGDMEQRGRELHERRQSERAGIAAADTSAARALKFGALTYPRVDGSTSAQPLGVVIACRVLGTDYRWAGTERYSGRWITGEEPVRYADVLPMEISLVSPGSLRLPNRNELTLTGYRAMSVPADTRSEKDVRLSVIINRLLTIHTGTHGAYENVIFGRADLGLVARRPSADELESAKAEGVELVVEPVALDAFVFIKNHDNPVTNLGTEQIRGIYSGRLKMWSDVGGAEKLINAYQRNRNSGSQELMRTLVMKDLPMYQPDSRRAPTLIRQGMGGPYIALSGDRQGLAYSVYYYEHFMAGSPNTRVVAVDGVVPSYETISDRTYPFVTEVYVVNRKGMAADSGPSRLKVWLLSDEGQAVVRESGYVPFSVGFRRKGR